MTRKSVTRASRTMEPPLPSEQAPHEATTTHLGPKASVNAAPRAVGPSSRPPRSTPPAPSDDEQTIPSDDEGPSKSKAGGAGALALKIIESNSTQEAVQYAQQLHADRESVATQAARVLGEIVAQKPQMAVSSIEHVAQAILSKNARVVSAAADALPVLAKIAPARVARHLDHLTTAFGSASPAGKDGLVRTFAALCAASVAYQKRLEPVLGKALGEADAKTLLRWTEIVLPSLKGEPHARARSVVEERLNHLPRAAAQRVAAFLGIKLRAPAR